jgi:citrate synthase
VYKKGKEKLVSVRKNHGASAHQDLKFNDCLDGMKHVSALLHENSFVDKKLGVTYKGYSLPEIKEFLARGQDSQGVETAEPLPEALYHLFLTGKFPKQQDMARLAEEINGRQGKNLDCLKTFINSLAKNMHPLT